MVAIVDTGDISELLDYRLIFGKRKNYTSVAWRRDQWHGDKYHLALLLDDEYTIRWLGRAQGRQAVSDRERRVDIDSIEQFVGLPLDELRQLTCTQDAVANFVREWTVIVRKSQARFVRVH